MCRVVVNIQMTGMRRELLNTTAVCHCAKCAHCCGALGKVKRSLRRGQSMGGKNTVILRCTTFRLAVYLIVLWCVSLSTSYSGEMEPMLLALPYLR